MSQSHKFYSILFCLIFLVFVAPINTTFAQTCIDADADGYGLNGDASCPNPGVDCNDANNTVYPGAPLKCDALDNNCDGYKDFLTDEDKDGDGEPWCAGDCDDNNPARSHNIVEGPFGDPKCSDFIDNDCDNKVDAADPECQDICNDPDGDGYGSPGHASCPNGDETDCNNNDPNVNPAGDDSNCNGIDENCDGTPDGEYVITATNCGVGECAATGSLICFEGGEINTCSPGAPVDEFPVGTPECEDGLDNDCDGLIDQLPGIEDPGCAPCTDNDGDGYGSNGDITCANGTEIDCNDNDATINPGASDANCNGIDEDCVGGADSGYMVMPTSCGLGECAANGQMECQGGTEVDTCVILPSNPEICDDGLDNDCDGLIDQVAGIEDPDCDNSFIDNDGDGYCADPDSCSDGSTPGDCDDTNITVYPGAPLLCDALDNNCDTYKDFLTDEDKDGDGVPWCAGDCNDNDPLRYPGNDEIFGEPSCSDGIDNDCNGLTDGADDKCKDQCNDADGDDYGNPGHTSCLNGNATDCNDNDAAINPGETDTNCDGVDNNCSGIADEGYIPPQTFCGVGECADTGFDECQNGTIVDTCVPKAPVPESPVGNPVCEDGLDNDCDGLIDQVPGIEDPGCAACTDNDQDGYGSNDDPTCQFSGVDCNDNDATINPGASDANCNGIDEDCVGGPDDGYVATPTICGQGVCASTGQLECIGGTEVDSCTPGIPTEDPEATCDDGLDNDCDGLTDQISGINDPDCDNSKIDNDGDGYCADPDSCSDGSTPGDCDDTHNTVYPGAPILCDALDNNCDTYKDFLTDEDKDGDGVPWCAGDCNDNDPLRYPGNIEGPFGDPICEDGIDNDCDNLVDNCPSDPCFDNDEDGYGRFGDPACPNPGLDCNDDDPAINPGAPDNTCDGVDNNCSGAADEGYVPTPTNCGVGECATTGFDECQNGQIVDTCVPLPPAPECPFPGDPSNNDGLDNDCDNLIDECPVGPCWDVDGDGYGVLGDPLCPNPGIDCNDTDPAINPGADDTNCNGIDEDCVGGPDSGYMVMPTICGEGVCASTGLLECIGGTEENSCTPGTPTEVPEVTCDDALDNDCDGLTDKISGIEDPDCDDSTIDNDGDGFCADPDACTDGSNPRDCDDTDPLVYPGAPIICDAKDSNCDGFKDFLTDEDKDEDGVPWCDGDCNDNDPLRFPGNPEGPFGDPTCEDGIDNDCDNNVDIVDSACAPPSCGTKFTPLDGPHIFDLLDPADDSVIATSCSWCHTDTLLGTGTEDQRVECQRCHADPNDTSDLLNGVLKDPNDPNAYSDNPPYGFGNPPNVKIHSSTVLGTKYGNWDMDCLTCHNPHLQEQNTPHGPSYGKYIKEFICYDNPVTGFTFEEVVEFTAATGPGSFADGVPHNENICEMCHTQTNYHRRDGSTVAHNDGDDCIDCHNHNDGFQPIGVADAPHNNTANPGLFDLCAVCHVSETDFTTPVPSANCLNCHDENAPDKAGGGSDIKVRSHFIGTMECIECHNPMLEQTNFRGNLNLSHIRTEINNNLIAFEAKTGPYSFADDTNMPVDMATENYICNTCHVDQTTNHHQADGTAPGGQSHNDGLDCTGCHTHQGGTVVPDAFRDHIENSQAHDPHNNDINPGLFDSCDVCHVTENDYVTPVPSANCLVCHDGTPATHVASHFVGTMECIECHNPMRDQAPNIKQIRTEIKSINGVPITPRAVTFTDNTTGAGFAVGDGSGICETCHTATTYYTQTGGGQPHETDVCTTCHTHPTGFTPPDDPAFGLHNTITDCSVCHDPGTYVLDAAIPNSKCNACHGDANASTGPDLETHHVPGDLTCVECHNVMRDQAPNIKQIRTEIKSINGVPITPRAVTFTDNTTGAGFAVGDGSGICETCHTATTYYTQTGGGQPHETDVCTSCHAHAAGFVPDTTPAFGLHNTITDCSVCHDPGTYVLDAAIPNSKCNACHGDANASTGPDLETHHVPGDLTCVECHNVMRDQAPNIKQIRTEIKSINGVPITPRAVTFTDNTTGAGFAVGDGSGICETCHTATTYYTQTGGGQPHETDVCTTCHTHPTGFTPPDDPAFGLHNTITDCSVCHDPGTYVLDAAIPNSKCNACHGDANASTGPDLETHHVPGDLTCVECHNVMRDQAPNIKQIRTEIKSINGVPITPRAVTFTDNTTGAGFAVGDGSGICETCHTATTYYTQTGGGQPHETDVCTSCHAHAAGFVPDTTPAFGLHNTITDCSVCHDPGTYVLDAAIPNSKCNACHGDANASTGPDLETHHVPGDLTCVECHNVMRDQAPNIKQIRTEIKSINGVPITPRAVTFTDNTTGAGFAVGDGSGICETCHTATTYYTQTGGGQPHETDVCTTCHTHPTGFTPPDDPAFGLHNTITDCSVCHDPGTYVLDAAIPNSKCNACHGDANASTGPDLETHHVPGDLTCVECHNVMRDQAPNIKQIRTEIKSINGVPITPRAVTFTDNTTGAGFAVGDGSGICETCHTATTYYTQTGGGQPHETDVCTTCHTHPTGFTPPDDPAFGLHNTITDCSVCHDPGTYVLDAAIPNSKCNACHGDANASTGPDLETHHVPGDLTCVECHNVMRDQAPNIKQIRTEIKSINGVPITPRAVTFTDNTTGAGFAVGDGSGICETCHTATTYYTQTGGGQPHETDVCTSCHAHAAGFVPDTTPAFGLHNTITDCSVCHDPGTYVLDAAIPNSKCNACHGDANASTGPDLETHHVPGDLTCVECHNVMRDQAPNIKQIRTEIKSINGVPITPRAVTFTDNTTGAGFAVGDGSGICETCHTATTYYTQTGGGQPHETDVCTTCHTHPTGFTPPDDPAFGLHNTITDCSVCHDPGTYVLDAAIPNSKCNACHGDANASTGPDLETHHVPGDLTCVECHNVMRDQAPNIKQIRTEIKSINGVPITPRAVTFTDNTTGAGFAVGDGSGICETCHTATTYYTQTGGGQPHETDVCTTCHTHPTGFTPPDDPAFGLHNTITDCSVCHDPGTYVLDAAIPNSKCNACHGDANASTGPDLETHHVPGDLTCVECHNVMRDQAPNIKQIRTEIKSINGVPITPRAVTFTDNTTGAGFAVGDGSGICETCHTATTYYTQTGGGQPHETDVCTTCHTHPTGFTPPDDPAFGLHNTITDCSVCHDPGTYVLDAAIPNSKCNACHGDANPATGPDLETHHNTPGDKTCVECHNVMRDQSPNIKQIRTSLAAFTDNAAGSDFVNGSNDGICQTCHAGTTYYNSAGNGAAHMTDVCTTCHTHGTGFTPPDDPAHDPHNPTDTPTFPNDCTVCHNGDDYVLNAPIPNSKCLGCHDVGAPGTSAGGSDTKVETHHHTPPDEDCVTCHNPMRDQTPNIMLIRTTLATFTNNTDWTDFVDGAGSGLCEVCHAGTTYFNDDGSGAMHMTDVCTNCHTHGTGFIVDDPADTPHDVITDCLACHNGADYFAGATLDNAKCLVCHGPGGPAIEAAAHQPLLAEDCTDCHNPMRAQTPNIKHVKTGLASFTNNTVWTDFVNGSNDGICQTCHTNTTYYKSDGSGAPHETDVCTNCHEHIAGFSAQGTCISCHTNVPGGATYVRRAVVSSDFTQASRHVFGGNGTTDVTQWDCAVCHMEADESLAALGGVDADTRDANLHNNSGGIVVDLRNVDDASNDAAGWTWNKKDGTCDNGSYDNITDCIDNGAIWTWNNEQMLTDMDNFCMSCHDGDGASDIAVNSAGTAVVLGDGACTGSGELACTPFNDALRTPNTKGGTGIIDDDDNSDGIPDSHERTEVVDVFSQFDPTNPSHHAVRAPAYNNHNADWGDAAWVDRELKNGDRLITDNIYESAQMHCADCHTVDYNAHGGVNGFMLQASSIDGTCFLCHNSSVYFDPDRAFRGVSRWDHDQEGSIWDPQDWVELGDYDGNGGSVCLNCHGGDPVRDGLGGIHGLPYDATTCEQNPGTTNPDCDPLSGEPRYRFQGGTYMSHKPDSWRLQTADDTSTCYFSDTQNPWAKCTQHTGDGTKTNRTGVGMNYDRGVPGEY